MKNSLKAIESKAHVPEHQVQIGEIANGIYDRQTLNNPPSLQALKMQDILMKKAGGAICEDRWFEMNLSDLKKIKGMGNLTHAKVVTIFRELRGAVLTYQNHADPNPYEGVYGFIAVGRVEFVEQGKMRWKFDEEFRKVVENSNFYAVLDRQTSLALSSRYAHRLHEMIALRGRMDKQREIFSVDDLRARLGVPNGKLGNWHNFKEFALKRAIDELNHLSRFEISFRIARKERRAVTHVELIWAEKRDLAPTKRELGRPKTGRKTRRNGTAEVPALAFPASGGIRYAEPWQTIAKTHGNGKDIDLIGKDFRNWCAGKKIPLDGRNIARQFETFCKGVSV